MGFEIRDPGFLLGFVLLLYLAFFVAIAGAAAFVSRRIGRDSTEEEGGELLGTILGAMGSFGLPPSSLCCPSDGSSGIFSSWR